MRRNRVTAAPWVRCITDLGLTWLALFLADLLRRAIPVGREIRPGTVYLTPAIYLIVGAIWFVSFVFFDVYGTNRRRAIDEIRIIVSAVSVSVLLLAGAIYFTRTRDFSRLLVTYFFALDIVFLLGSRWFSRIGSALIRRTPRAALRTVIVGTGPTALEVARRFETHPYAGFELIGYITANPDEDTSPNEERPLLGHLDNLRQIVKESQAECAILALPITKANQTTPAILRLQGLPTRIYVVPDYIGIVSLESRVEDLFGVPLIGISETQMSGWNRALKRTIDLAIALIGSIFMLPIFAIIAIAIRLDSSGPILFAQKRVGENGATFKMLKFRSMVVDAEEALDQLLDGQELEAPPLKLDNDPRITRVGHILRRTSLDELPQLFNVIKGEMSLVGPRPEEQRIVQTYNIWHRKRLLVKPGITGPMQVNGRADLALDDRVRLELDYIQNYSLLEDIRLLARTLPAVISGKGSY